MNQNLDRKEIHTKTNISNFPSTLHTLLCTHTQALLQRKESLVSPDRVEKVSTCNWGRGGKRRIAKWEKKKDSQPTGRQASGHEEKSDSMTEPDLHSDADVQ